MSVEITPTQGTGEVSIPEDFAAYKAYRETGELPKVESSEAAGEPAAESASESETEERNTEQSEDESTEENERDENGRFKSKRGLNKRFSELTSKIRELEAKLGSKADAGITSPEDNSQPKAAAEGKPESKDFDSYDEYLDALSDWKLDQREKQREQARIQREQQARANESASAWAKREDAVRAKHEDYEDAVSSLKIPATPAVPALREFLSESEQGPELMYHLAKNPSEAERILRLSPVRAIAEISKIEAQLSEKNTPKTTATKTVTKAPAPPQTLGGKSSPGHKPLYEENDYNAYVARRQKGEKA